MGTQKKKKIRSTLSHFRDNGSHTLFSPSDEDDKHVGSVGVLAGYVKGHWSVRNRIRVATVSPVALAKLINISPWQKKREKLIPVYHTHRWQDWVELLLRLL